MCTLQVRIITSNNCLSAGDALRDIDQRGVVRSDPFILVSGDVVSNIDLKSVIKQVRCYCSVAVSLCCGRSIACMLMACVACCWLLTILKTRRMLWSFCFFLMLALPPWADFLATPPPPPLPFSSPPVSRNGVSRFVG